MELDDRKSRTGACPMTIQLYTWSTPNGRKISILLEELGVPYEVHTIDITKDEQFSQDFLAINPNNKLPAILDPAGPADAQFTLFESGAIPLYPPQTHQRPLCPDPHRTAGKSRSCWRNSASPTRFTRSTSRRTINSVRISWRSTRTTRFLRSSIRMGLAMRRSRCSNPVQSSFISQKSTKAPYGRTIRCCRRASSSG